MSTQNVLVEQTAPLVLKQPDQLQVAILGFGTVGRSVARILSEGRVPRLELAYVFNRNVEEKRVSWTAASVHWTQSIDEVLESDADVVIEAIGGVEPAKQWVTALLQSGRSVVTANKQLIARYGPELSRIAHQHGCQLLFGASVAGGVPIITALEQGLAGDEIQSVCGILNGTCNYILSRVEEGQSFAVALQQAQELGFAEADPTDDIAGYDTRAKLVILARVALHAELSLNEISCTPISSVAPVDFEYASELGCTIRQIGHVELNDDRCLAAVEPMVVRKESPLARARGCENVVLSEGKFGGITAFSGAGAGGNATAVAVISDLLALTREASAPIHRRSRVLEVSADCVAPYYLRFVVKDRPGIVASIAAILASFEINVDAVFQKPGHAKEKLPFVITVEPCSNAKVQAAMEQVSQCEFLVEPPLRLRIFGH